jgi:hypothetical protein
MSAAVLADFEPWKDYELSDEVWVVTTVKVHSNMEDAYLEGLANTWAPGMDISKKLGQVEDYFMYRSDYPNSGDFNLLLVVKFKNTEMLAPNKKRYDEFMAAFTKERSDEATDFAQKNYPAMRELTGGYQMRQITLK